MERESQASGSRTVLHRYVREGRIPDREIEIAGQRCLVEIDATDELAGIEGTGNACGDWVVLDTDEERVAGEEVRPQPHEQPAAATGFEDLAAGEAEDAGGLPHGPDDVFRRIVRILRGTLERLKFGFGGFSDKALPEFFPALPVFIATAGEDVVGKLGRAEADELRDRFLFRTRRSSIFAIDQVQQADRLDIVMGAALPRRGECPSASEREIDRQHVRRLCLHLEQVGGDRGCLRRFWRGLDGLVEVQAQLERQRGCTVSHGSFLFRRC